MPPLTPVPHPAPLPDTDQPGVTVTMASRTALVTCDLDERYQTGHAFQKTNSAHWIAPHRMHIHYQLGADGWAITAIVLIGHQVTRATLVYADTPADTLADTDTREHQRSYNEDSAPSWAATIARALRPDPTPRPATAAVLVVDQDQPGEPARPVALPGVPHVGDRLTIDGNAAFVVDLTWDAGTGRVLVAISATPVAATR